VLRHDDADAWIWLRRRDAAAYEPADAVPPPPAGMRLGDPGVQLADIDGDRIPDLVRILSADSRILVAPGAGLGFFDDPIDMTGVPEMSETDRWELADVNGDGAADLLRIGAQLGLWVNQLDGSFAHAVTADWPTLEADEVILVTDIDASGTLDILRVDTDGSQPWRAWSLYPERPGLLARFENGLGYTREHTYRPAAQLAAADAAAGRHGRARHPTDARAHRDPRGRRRRLDLHPPPRPARRLVRPRPRRVSRLRRAARRDHWRRLQRGRDHHAHYDLGREDEARALQLLAAETRSPRGLLVREAHTLTVDSPREGRPRSPPQRDRHLPRRGRARVRRRPRAHRVGSRRLDANVLEERALGRVDRETGADIPGDERITTSTYATPQTDDAPATASPSRS
jgi:hypothetical protein